MTGKKVSKKAAKNEIANTEVPSWMNAEDGRGDENVTNDDILIPRLELAQALSDCVKKKNPAYIEGIEVGHFYNSLTREIYGDETFFIPVLFDKQYAVWIDRDSGGGFRGMYDTAEEAGQVSEAEEKPSEVIDTGMHYGLVVTGDRTEQMTIPMSRSKMKASRNLNSLCRMTPGPRFAQVYRFASFENSGAKGDFIDMNVEMVRTMADEDKPLYDAAETLYDLVKSGKTKMHDDDLGDKEEGEDEY